MAPFDQKRNKSPVNALSRLSYDLAAECDLVSVALERPQLVVGNGVRPKHFFDPALGALYHQCELLYCVYAVKVPFSVMPERLPADSWWRKNWETDGRHIFLFVLFHCGESDPTEAARTIRKMAEWRGVK